MENSLSITKRKPKATSKVHLSEQDNNLSINQLSLDLFYSSEDAADHDTTRSLRIYDLAPKYCHQNPVSLLSQAKTATFTREFSIKNQLFSVNVQAATIEDKDGREYVAFPSNNEELVEAALRKMAISGCGFNYNGSLGAKFSIYSLQQELKLHGHNASYDQLKRSIMILRRSSLRITDKKTGAAWEENFFPQLGIGGWQEKPGAEYDPWFVSFHKLITDNIIKLQYRDLNFADLMRIKGMLARYLFQRMVLLYTFANPNEPYEPSRNQILTESGYSLDAPSNRLSERFERAVQQLVDAGIVERWKILRREKTGRRVTNIFYAIYPTKHFTHDIVKANNADNRRARLNAKSRMSELKAGL